MLRWPDILPHLRFRPSHVVLLAAVVAVGTPGCVRKPSMELHDARVQTASPAGVHMDIHLLVRNKNRFDIQVRNVRVDATLAGRHRLPPIQYSPNVWLRAKSKQIVRVPMIIPWFMVPTLLAETARSPTIPYRVRGVADVTGTSTFKVKRDSYPVDEKGKIPRNALLMAARSVNPFGLPY